MTKKEGHGLVELKENEPIKPKEPRINNKTKIERKTMSA
jgi:hypothetical protein